MTTDPRASDGLSEGVLLYDGDCAFCTRAARFASSSRFRVAVQAMQSADLASKGVDLARATREVPFVRSDGGVDYGHRAIACVLASGSCRWRFVARLMTWGFFDDVARLVYQLVARNRHRLWGASAECRINDASNS